MSKECKMKKSKLLATRDIKIIGLLVLLFILTYCLNFLYPLLNDDWEYTFTNLGKRVSSFSDILATQYDHYFTWGGRTVVHVIAQCLLWIGKPIANLLNSIAYVVLIFVMFSIGNKEIRKKYTSAWSLIFLFIAMWFLQSDYGETTLWITGSANYMWGTLIILLFLYPYCSYYYSRKCTDSILKSLLFFIAGIIAGWTNENMAVALFTFIVVLFIFIKTEKDKIPAWAIWGVVGVIIGMSFMLLAPGNQARYMEVTKDITIDTIYYIKRAIASLKLFVRYGLLPLFLYIVLLILFVKQKQHLSYFKTYRLSILFYATSLIGFMVMIASPNFPPRAWFGIITFAIIAIFLLYIHIDFDKTFLSVLNKFCLITAIVLFAISYYVSVKELHRINCIFNDREMEIMRQKNEDKENIVLYGKFKSDKNILRVVPKIRDFPNDTSNWRYTLYNHYYGVKSIKVLEDTVSIKSRK